MQKQTRIFQVAVLCAICWTIVMRLFSPSNIVQFEMAGSTTMAAEIILNWGTDGVALAKGSIYLDFIYIIFYCTAIALGCRIAARYSENETIIKVGTVVSRLTLVAGFCDVIENIAMLISLHEINSIAVSIAYYFASTKFAILLMALLFILIAFTIGVLRKFRK